jgi:predicted nucleotidyltransferase component of viral defense system
VLGFLSTIKNAFAFCELKLIGYTKSIFEVSKYPENFIFKGGTCLRVCFGTERASEDLDFSTNLGISKIKEIINKCLKDFEMLNIPYEIYSEKEFEGNIRIEIRFKGPLFTGQGSSTNTLKIDFNKGKAKNKIVKVIQKLFSDIPLFMLVALDEKEILAEKIRALANRGESKDLYDVWVLLNKKAEVDKNLIFEKLKEEKSSLSNLKFPSKEEYERDLKNLVSYTPSYEQAIREVSEMINKIKEK